MKIESLEEFVREISKLRVTRSPFGGDKYLFRGHSDESYELIPQLARPFVAGSNIDYMIYENRLVDESKIKLPGLLYPTDSTAITLTKLQHYGIPTRLLDFTENALVALYFACTPKEVKKEKLNGEVIIVQEDQGKIWNCFSPYVQAIADTTIMGGRSDMNFQEYKQTVLRKHFSQVEKPPEQAVDEALINTLSSPIFFTSIEETERQKRQQGMFCIFPNTIKKEELPINDYREEWIVYSKINAISKSDKNIRIITIPSDVKRRIRNDLAKFGITKRFLFPELDKICDEIKDNAKRNQYENLELYA